MKEGKLKNQKFRNKLNL